MDLIATFVNLTLLASLFYNFINLIASSQIPLRYAD